MYYTLFHCVFLFFQISQADGTEGLQVVNSVGDHSDNLQVHTVTTDSGEVLHIQQTDHATE